MIFLICVGLNLILGPLAVAAPQDEAPKPKVSNQLLTTEQVAVYRALIEDYSNGTNSPLNIAERTYPLDESDKACLKGSLKRSESSVPIIHQIDSTLLVNRKFVLVDPDQQAELIKKNDPQKILMNHTDENKVPSPTELDNSVNRAFATGLFTLSEILFDKKHQRAVVAYSFACGMLCGHGSTLVLRRVGSGWKVSKACGGWVS